MQRKKLTDTSVNAAKADIADTLVPGLLLRVRDSGAKSYALVARYPGSPNPTRRSLGKIAAVSLAEARAKARGWLDLLARGKDPAAEIERERAEAEALRQDTIAVVAEAYLAQQIIGPNPAKPKARAHYKIVQHFRDILIPLFGERPITELTSKEVSIVLMEIQRHGTDRGLVKLGVRKELRNPNRAPKPAPMQARFLFIYLGTMLRWAVDVGDYGLKVSPLGHVDVVKRYGAATKRDRYLNDIEIGSAWRAAGTLRSPYRQFYRMLMLTGLRYDELREASWSEFDAKLTEWTIPGERMKGRNGKAQEHTVPVTPLMRDILHEVPRGPRGSFVFSLDDGARAICPRGRGKHMLDAAIVADMDLPDSALRNPSSPVQHFTNHDLRRTLRTRGRKLGIGSDIGEAMLAHVIPGTSGIYDHYDRLDERRDAHVKWGEFLLGCADQANNVVRMPKAASR